MKKLKLFFALFAMLALGVGNAWGADYSTTHTSNVTLTAGSNGSSAKVIINSTEYDAIKLGTSSKVGTMTFTIPVGTTKIHLHVAGWNGKNTKFNISAENGVTLAITSITSTADTGINNNSPFTINSTSNVTSSYYKVIDIKSGATTSETTITITTTSTGYRAVIWGVNAETAGGGENPGEGGGENPDSGEETSATMTAGTNGTACTVNGKDGIKVGTSSKGGDMQITVPASATMLHVYAAAWNGVNSLSLNITPTSNVTTTSITLKTNTGIANSSPFTLSGDEADYLFDIPLQNITAETTLTFTSSTAKRFVVWGATYETASGGEPEPVIVKMLKSIAVTGMTTTFEQGDVFKFDGTCTATYSVTKDDVAQADETAEVTPTSVSAPKMNQIGTQTVTVTYSEGGVDKTDEYEITITENTVTAGEYCITPNNEFWGTNFNGSLSGDALNQTYTGRQDDITIQYAKGSSQYMYINDSQTRVYGNNSLTFSVPSGYVITAIAFTADGTNWKGTHTSNVGSMTDSKNWAGSANEVTITFGDNCRITKICVTYEELDLTLPSAPTFNPEAGTYNAVQNVTISAEAGTIIYYTLDGTDPTTASNVYASAIEISETTTVKAIAVRDEKVSPVVSATYTIKLPLTTMDQIFAKATAVGSSATSVEITFGNWVVSAIKDDNKTAFVTDGTKGFVIYEAGCGFKVGDVLSGTAACKVLLYNGFAELTGLTSSTTGLTVSTGGTITTQELDATAIEALTGVNTGSLIKINGICSSSDSKYYVAGVQIYTALYDFGTLNVGAEYNITGIYQPYNSTKEMLPRSAEDIEEVVGLPTATIEVSNITMEVGQEKAIEATITPDAAQSTVQYAITSGSEYITLDGTTITARAAGTATITATIAEKADEYKGATKEFTVTVKPQNIAVLPFTFNGGKADIENTLGMSQTGLETDYGSAPKLKFNGVGDNVIIHFDSQAGEFSFLLKQNGTNAGTFTVYESANGEDYTPVWSGGNIGNTKSETITPTLAESSRYVKFEYTTKGEGTNYALGSISIAKPDFRQEAGLAWSVESVILNQGDEFTAPTLSNDNDLTLTCSSTEESVATVTSEGVITLAGAIGTTTITASFAGNEYYKAAEVSCKITVNKAQLPTGTFALYSGDIVEGDYVITYENYAMNTTSSAAPRLQYQEVIPSENKLENPANQIVWHIAADGEYWTLYNNYDEVYAVSTGVKNQATTAAEVTDNAKWSITGPKMFDFENYERANSTTDNENKYLRKNNDVGFACYKNSTGGALTLYRKQTQHTVTVATCTNGSVSASVENGATVLSGEIITLSNTPDAGYLLTEYNVYKTGDETVKVTVTDGTFMMPAFDVTISAIFATITLTTGNNDDIIAANIGNTVNVVIERSFTANAGYYTLCVPFNMPASVIGKAYSLETITEHVSGQGINIELKEESELTAGMPYLVLPKANMSELVVENVTILEDPAAGQGITNEELNVQIFFGGFYSAPAAPENQTNGTTQYYVGNNGYLYNEVVDIRGLCGLFTITDREGDPLKVRARVVAGENGVTGVEDIITNDAPQKVIENGQLIIIRGGVKYNVQGVRL